MLVEVILLLVLLTCCCSKKYIRPSSPTRATGAMVQLEQASLQLDGAAGAGVSAAGFRTSANQHVPSSAAGHPGSAHEQSVAQPVRPRVPTRANMGGDGSGSGPAFWVANILFFITGPVYVLGSQQLSYW